ncbi:MAG: methyltransferase domain-containing protein [Candidatus Cloacimonetes bacterium]|nr:methyltransferase domain-containing protein [Candidatus Cloacimonadota bacterium]
MESEYSRELSRQVKEYYATRARVYDQTAGYDDQIAEKLRLPAKKRIQAILKGRKVLEIACGTGYWTDVASRSASSVLATDINPEMLCLAAQRLQGRQNVDLQIADAYHLTAIPANFSAGFAVWWWSHIPRERVIDFLEVFHGKLLPGAVVLFADQLPDAYIPEYVFQDNSGNNLERRTLPEGIKFDIVKNYPSQQDLLHLLKGWAKRIRYYENKREKNWYLTYLLK